MTRADELTLEDVRRSTMRNAYAAALDYVTEGRVLDVTVAADGRRISGRVRGSMPRPYEQDILLVAAGGGRHQISGNCTCPFGHNCKHVAAVLVAHMDRRGQPAFKPIILPQPRTPTPATDALGPGIEAWLLSLEKAQHTDSEDYPPDIRKRLIYALDGVRHARDPRVALRVALTVITVTNSGAPVGRTLVIQSYALISQAPKYLRPSDHAILRRLATLGERGSDIAAAAAADTLTRIIATGRARWGGPAGGAIVLGDARPARIVWRLGPDGLQRPEIDLAPGLIALSLAAPWYVEPATATMGPLVIDLPPRQLDAVLAAPPLPPEAVARVRAELARREIVAWVPPPPELENVHIVAGPPRPRLRFLRIEPSHGQPTAVPMARLSLLYGDIEVSPFEKRALHSIGGGIFQVERDQGAEATIRNVIDDLGFERAVEAYSFHGLKLHRDDLTVTENTVDAWLAIMFDELPRLRDAGWDIVIDDDFPLRVAVATGPIEADIQSGSGIDWFELQLGAIVNGVRVDLVPALLEALRKPHLERVVIDAVADDDDSNPFILQLTDGRLLSIPLGTIRPILATLLEMHGGDGLIASDGGLAVKRGELAGLAPLEGAGLVWRGGEAALALGRALRDHGGIPVATLPATFHATLRPYQARGVDWLQFLRTAGLGGVLADDMGLGKTVQTLAHFTIEKAAGRLDRPALVVCPTSLVPNWQAEATRFAPDLRVLALHGTDRKALFDSIAAHDVVISTYPLLFRDHEVLTALDWRIVVLDEAHTLKNPAATTSMHARQLRADQRIGLSGTPLQNHLGELWALMDFIMPGFLGDQRRFHKRFRTPIEKAGDTEKQALLARRVAPFLLRRTKQAVATELPDKTEITETVELQAAQRAIYEGIRLAMHTKVRAAIADRGLSRSGIIILDALLKLRQACCDPRLLKLTTARNSKAGSAKLERLMEMLPTMLEEGRGILLFSQFTSMLALIRETLDEQQIPYVLLTGDTKDRATPVAQFQAGKVKLFLISLKAGGVGLNLTAADTVIHYDPWWNPAVEDQATDRAHRIGQQRAVFVHRLVAKGTIEEKMETLKARKQALVSGILDAKRDVALSMTEEDLETLFAPA